MALLVDRVAQLAWIAALGLLLAVPVYVGQEPLPSGRLPRAPIDITNDSEFTWINGVNGGDGSAGNPYRIAGWSIAGAGASPIVITGTSKHVVIENNALELSFMDMQSPYSAAIRLNGTTNVTIAHNEISSSQFGVHVREARSIVIRSNDIDGLQVPAPGLIVISNGGVHVIDSVDVTVLDNSITGFGWGLTIQGASRNAFVERNAIQGTVLSGALNVLRGAAGVTLVGNTVRDAPTAASVKGSLDVVIANNTFEDVSRGFVFDRQYSAGGGPSERVWFIDNVVHASGYIGYVDHCDLCAVMHNRFTGSGDGLDVIQPVRITHNVFEDNGLVLSPWVHEGAIISNNTFSLTNELYAQVLGGTLDLRMNWWDTATGPDMDRFDIQGQAEVLVMPWLAQAPPGVGPRTT